MNRSILNYKDAFRLKNSPCNLETFKVIEAAAEGHTQKLRNLDGLNSNIYDLE